MFQQNSQTLSPIEQLPNDIYIDIFSYLTIKEIYLIMPCISKSFYQTYNTIKNQILRVLVARYLGLDIIPNIQNQKLQTTIFESMFKQHNFYEILLNQSQNLLDLPILGYKTNGGIDDGNTEYWVDKAFQRTYGTICTKEGNNFSIMGVLNPSECPILKSAQLQECERFLNQVLEIFHKKFQDQGDQMQQGAQNLQKMQIIQTFLQHDVSQLQFLIQLLTAQLSCKQNEIENNINFIKKYYIGQQNLKLKCYKQNLYVTQKGINVQEQNEDYQQQQDDQQNSSQLEEEEEQKINENEQQQQQQQNLNQLHRHRHHQNNQNSDNNLGNETNNINSNSNIGAGEQEEEQEINPRQEYPQYPILHSYTLEADTNIQNLQQYVSIVKGVEISRSMEMLTCPLKTCVLFTSLQSIDFETSMILNQFNNIKTSQQICHFIQNNKYQITKSNIQQLKPFCIEFDEKCQEQSLQYVIFDNQLSQVDKNRLLNDQNQDFQQSENQDYQIVKPVIWVTFNDTNLWKYRFEMIANRFFMGRYFIIKLIECENKMQEFLDQHTDTNVDMNYCLFQGEVLDIKKTSLNNTTKNSTNKTQDGLDIENNQNNFNKFDNFKLFENPQDDNILDGLEEDDDIDNINTQKQLNNNNQDQNNYLYGQNALSNNCNDNQIEQNQQQFFQDGNDEEIDIDDIDNGYNQTQQNCNNMINDNNIANNYYGNNNLLNGNYNNFNQQQQQPNQENEESEIEQQIEFDSFDFE